jgi:hypothetical protein
VGVAAKATYLQKGDAPAGLSAIFGSGSIPSPIGRLMQQMYVPVAVMGTWWSRTITLAGDELISISKIGPHV